MKRIFQVKTSALKTLPEFSVFADSYRAGTAQIVWTRLVADLETPVSALLKLAEGQPNSFLFESVEGGARREAVGFEHERLRVKAQAVLQVAGGWLEHGERGLAVAVDAVLARHES